MTELEDVSFPPFLPTLYFHTLLTESPSRGSRSPSLKPPSFWTDSPRRFSKNGFGTRKSSVHRMRCFVRTTSGHAPNRAQLIQGLGGGGKRCVCVCTASGHRYLLLPSTNDVVRRTFRAKGSDCGDAANHAGGEREREKKRANFASSLENFFPFSPHCQRSP